MDGCIFQPSYLVQADTRRRFVNWKDEAFVFQPSLLPLYGAHSTALRVARHSVLHSQKRSFTESWWTCERCSSAGNGRLRIAPIRHWNLCWLTLKRYKQWKSVLVSQLNFRNCWDWRGTLLQRISGHSVSCWKRKWVLISSGGVGRPPAGRNKCAIKFRLFVANGRYHLSNPDRGVRPLCRFLSPD